MFERLNTKIEGANNKKDGIDTVTMIKMIQDSEDRGYQRRKDIDELADERAERLRDEAGDKEDKPESLATSLIKGFMPVITQAVQAQAAQAAQPQVQPQPTPAQLDASREAQQARLQHARGEQFRREQELLAKQRQQNKARANAAQNAATVAAAKSGTSTVVQDERTIVEDPARRGQGTGKIVERDGLGLPKASNQGPGTRGQAPTVSEKMNGDFKPHVSSLVLPVIAEYLTNQGDPVQNAQKCAAASLAVLQSKGITRKEVLAAFKFEDIIALARSKSLPLEVDPWFEIFWNALSGIQGESVKDVNIQNSTGNELAGPA
jgi:hypothetical protein